jgi:hypothetical protein
MIQLSENSSQSIVQLQKVLKGEAKDKLDEKAIIDMDDEVLGDIDRVIQKYKKLKDIEE